MKSLASEYPEIATEWDYEKNEKTPEEVAPHSQKYAWWKCKKGHSWSAIINSRSAGAKCPYCAGKKILVGVNDLATLAPDIAAEWDLSRNGELLPSQVSLHSNKVVWWRCRTNPEHVWKTSINHRTTDKTGCPYCNSNRLIPGKNDTATLYPELMEQLAPEMNEEKSLCHYHPTSNQPFYWKCRQGHIWKTSIYARTQGCNCPICAGVRVVEGMNDLPTLYPEIAVEWNEYRNGRPVGLTAKDSEEKVWWICSNCGFEWKMTVINRTKHHAGCPSCQYFQTKSLHIGLNDLQTCYPHIAAEWNYEKNRLLTPSQVTQYSNRKVWWKCAKGHAWQATISNRTMIGEGCPLCLGRRMRKI